MNASQISLYYGDNGVHEFWEDAERQHLIIRNHGDSRWLFLRFNGEEMPAIGSAKAVAALLCSAKRLGASLALDTTRQWFDVPKSRKQKMLLLPVLQPRC